MNNVYFWMNNKVVTVPVESYLVLSDFIRKPRLMKYVDCHCVDTGRYAPSERYGVFRRNISPVIRDIPVKWQVISLDQFPPEFRAHLLLLGVA